MSWGMLKKFLAPFHFCYMKVFFKMMEGHLASFVLVCSDGGEWTTAILRSCRGGSHKIEGTRTQLLMFILGDVLLGYGLGAGHQGVCEYVDTWIPSL